MHDFSTFYVTLGIALISLLVTFGVFRYLESHAEARGLLGKQKVRYGGALAGFVIIFSTLFGAYYSIRPPLVTTPFDLTGQWTLEFIPSNGKRLHGVATIVQAPGDPYLDVVGEIEGPTGEMQIAFSSLFGIVRGNEVYFIYRNLAGEQGIAQGTLLERKPRRMSVEYHDLIGFDKNNDPTGLLEFSRKGDG